MRVERELNCKSTVNSTVNTVKINYIAKAARGWAVCIVYGGYAVKGDGAGTGTFDRIAPTGNCGTPRTGNASEDWQRLR